MKISFLYSPLPIRLRSRQAHSLLPIPYYQDILQKGRQQEALALIKCEQLQKLMRKSAANVR
ncbi:hypothetical protein [Nostoc sp.]|uniref:hypothetical protein n=1 Tax=Nostoc sp. TaxID=1180 RepID=UPI002FF85949